MDKIEVTKPTPVPLSLLEAHAVLANECDAWKASWTKDELPPNTMPLPNYPRDASQEFVCQVAQQPKATLGEIEDAMIHGVLFALLVGALGGYFLRVFVKFTREAIRHWRNSRSQPKPV